MEKNMYGHVFVRYNNEPIIYLYSVTSTKFDEETEHKVLQIY